MKLAFSDVYLSFRNKHGLLVIAHQVLLLRQPTFASPIVVVKPVCSALPEMTSFLCKSDMKALR